MGREMIVGKRMTIFAIVFYVAVSLLAVAIMNDAASFFNNSIAAITENKNKAPTVLEDSLITGDVTTKAKNTEPVEYETDEAKTMVMDDSEGNITVQPGVLVDNSEGEETEEEETEEEETKHYYSFKASNTTTILHMREEPDINSRSIYKLKPGTTGYVLELGDEWSQVTAEGHVGYCSNEYLIMTEIPEEEYPEELR